MMYLRYLLYWIGSCIVSAFCYVTNPIVVLFCDENGELHGFLRYWQTWDDSCDSEFYVTKHAPKIFRYDYYAKYDPYSATTTELLQVGRSRDFSRKKLMADFSLKERIQRYFCRVLWLTRNCGYGFNFWWFGATVDGSSMNYRVNEPGREIGDNGKYFIIHSDAPIVKLGKITICWKVFLGWKICSDPGARRSMLANRFLISFELD